MIQKELDKRRPGHGKLNSPRKETDQYRAYKDIFRPGHATYSFFLKYGDAQNWCGAGRASGRETVGRVAGGAVAKFILQREKIEILAYTKECMGIRAKDMTWNTIRKNYGRNEINCPDMEAAKRMEKKVLEIKKEGDTAGGIIRDSSLRSELHLFRRECHRGLGGQIQTALATKSLIHPTRHMPFLSRLL